MQQMLERLFSCKRGVADTQLAARAREVLKSCGLGLAGGFIATNVLLFVLLQYSYATVLAAVPLLRLPLLSLAEAHELNIGRADGGPRRKKRKTTEEETESNAMDESDDTVESPDDHWGVDENCRELVDVLKAAEECWERATASGECRELLQRIWSSPSGVWVTISLCDVFTEMGESVRTVEMLQGLLVQLRSGTLSTDGLAALSEGRVTTKDTVVFSLELKVATLLLLSGKETLRGRELLFTLLTRVQCPEVGRVSQWKGGRNRGGVRMCFCEANERTVALTAAQLLINSCRAAGEVGDAVVLTQFAWPYFEGEFSRIVASITQKGEFRYRQFFDHVVSVHLLEELLFLASQGVALSITPDHQHFHTGAASMTRDLLLRHVEALHLPERHVDVVLLSFFRKRAALADAVATTM